MNDTIKKEEKMKKITIANDTVEVAESLYHFKQLMELRDREIKDVNQLVADYQKFINLWDNFKEMEKQAGGESDFEKKLNRQILAHTIKPKTKYAHQQEKKNANLFYTLFIILEMMAFREYGSGRKLSH